MKYIVASLPVLVSVASAAEIIGTYWVAEEEVLPTVLESKPEGELYTLFASTSTQSSDVAPTPVSVNSWAYTDEVPYWHMTEGGYTDLDCGYGYSKDDWGYCQPADWYTDAGCYETVIINKKKKCHPMVVTDTEDVTGWVIEHQPDVLYYTYTVMN